MKNRWIWWKHGIIYQIYPRSFKDSNSDGIGDIPGIISKLDYLEDIGIDAIWLSPVNRSPMKDFGYDISDYYAIDPIYGTLSDMKRLITEAEKRNIRIIMDLVINHTSDLHPWFIESRQSKTNPKQDWYIWKDGAPGKLPNNWQSCFGGSVWEWDDQRQQYYMHSFLKEQPDINWHNEEVKNEILNMIKYWLELGIGGFRLDVVNWYFKDKKFRNHSFHFIPDILRKKRYDRNQPETHYLLKEFRLVCEEYQDRMLVGEVFSLPPGDPALSSEYLGDGTNELHLAFDFSLIYRPWNAKIFYKAIKKWDKLIPEKGWPCYVFSNHDQPRSINRWSGIQFSEEKAKAAAMILFTLRGTPFIYYGEEIGMKNLKLKKNEILDPLGKKYWPFYKGRDISRGPMQWNHCPFAGFSDQQPWIRINDDYKDINVEIQLEEENSILNFYKKIIRIRKENSALQKGDIFFTLKGTNEILSYIRSYKNQIILIAINFAKGKRKLKIEYEGTWKVLYSTNRSSKLTYSKLYFDLYPFEAILLEKI